MAQKGVYCCLVSVAAIKPKHPVIVLDSNKVTVGRSPDVDVCLRSNVISRLHAILMKNTNGDNTWSLSDTGVWTYLDNKNIDDICSKFINNHTLIYMYFDSLSIQASLNGVYVNSQPVEKNKQVTLHDGDIIQFGVSIHKNVEPEFIYKFCQERTINVLKRKRERDIGETPQNKVFVSPKSTERSQENGKKTVIDDGDLATTSTSMPEPHCSRTEVSFSRDDADIAICDSTRTSTAGPEPRSSNIEDSFTCDSSDRVLSDLKSSSVRSETRSSKIGSSSTKSSAVGQEPHSSKTHCSSTKSSAFRPEPSSSKTKSSLTRDIDDGVPCDLIKSPGVWQEPHSFKGGSALTKSSAVKLEPCTSKSRSSSTSDSSDRSPCDLSKSSIVRPEPGSSKTASSLTKTSAVRPGLNSSKISRSSSIHDGGDRVSSAITQSHVDTLQPHCSRVSDRGTSRKNSGNRATDGIMVKLMKQLENRSKKLKQSTHTVMLCEMKRLLKAKDDEVKAINSILEVERGKSELKEQELKDIKEQQETLLKEIQDKKVERETDNVKKKSVTKDNAINVMETEFTCIICSELFIKATTLNCSHSFCLHCINEWRAKKNECPICRAVVTSQTHAIVLDNFIEEMLKKANPELLATRTSLIAQRHANDTPQGGSDGATTRDVARTNVVLVTDTDDDDEDSEIDDAEFLYGNHDLQYEAEYDRNDPLPRRGYYETEEDEQRGYDGRNDHDLGLSYYGLTERHNGRPRRYRYSQLAYYHDYFDRYNIGDREHLQYGRDRDLRVARHHGATEGHNRQPHRYHSNVEYDRDDFSRCNIGDTQHGHSGDASERVIDDDNYYDDEHNDDANYGNSNDDGDDLSYSPGSGTNDDGHLPDGDDYVDSIDGDSYHSDDTKTDHHEDDYDGDCIDGNRGDGTNDGHDRNDGYYTDSNDGQHGRVISYDHRDNDSESHYGEDTDDDSRGYHGYGTNDNRHGYDGGDNDTYMAAASDYNYSHSEDDEPDGFDDEVGDYDDEDDYTDVEIWCGNCGLSGHHTQECQD